MPQSNASGESPRSNATRHNRDGGKLSAASGGESEAEYWAVPQSSASGGSPRSSATRHNRDGGKLSAATGGGSEAEYWAVLQSNASGGSPRCNATRHNRVESLKEHFPLRGGFMLRLMACIHLAGTLGLKNCRGQFFLNALD